MLMCQAGPIPITSQGQPSLVAEIDKWFLQEHLDAMTHSDRPNIQTFIQLCHLKGCQMRNNQKNQSGGVDTHRHDSVIAEPGGLLE